MLTDQDIYLFREGTHGRMYERLGARLAADGSGAHFAVWAPNAAEVSVVGDWNGWNAGANRLAPRGDQSGIWEGSVPGARHGDAYKYRINSHVGG
jgi:1,4-alpha-glucan branching enzyme